MLEGWKTTVGSVLAAMATAMLTLDLKGDDTVHIVGKLMLAASVALVGTGLASKADKMTAAMGKPVEVLAASPAARAELEAATESRQVKPVPTPEEQAILDKFKDQR